VREVDAAVGGEWKGGRQMGGALGAVRAGCACYVLRRAEAAGCRAGHAASLTPY